MKTNLDKGTRAWQEKCWCFSEPHQWMFDACSDDQLERYMLPLMDGTRKL